MSLNTGRSLLWRSIGASTRFQEARPLRAAGRLRSLSSIHSTNLRRPSSQTACRQVAKHRAEVQQERSYSSGDTEPAELKKTPLYDLHIKHGGKMVEFGGYAMPVQYSDLGVGESHKWTREKSSLFDVSHMVQHHISGPGAEGLLLRLTPASLKTLKEHQSTLAVFLHPKTGGIVDDTVITRLGPEEFYVVTNAACRDKDLKYLEDNIELWESQGNGTVNWEVLKDQGLIALQGPLSSQILEEFLVEPEEVNLDKLWFGNSVSTKLSLPTGQTFEKVLISRGGYTGEDGFEISLPPSVTLPFTEYLLEKAGSGRLRLAGLGARDSLRLEAGMCLYGHDLDDTTTPVEGGLGWTVGKDRRDEGGFNGDSVILSQLKTPKQGGKGVSRRRVGFIVEGAPAREGAEIRDLAGEVIGKITSGCPSPTLGKNIAMGYVKSGHHKAGTEVGIIVRHKRRKAFVTKMPFIETKYWKNTAPA